SEMDESKPPQVIWMSGLLLGRHIERSIFFIATSASTSELVVLLLIHSFSFLLNLFLFLALAGQNTKRNVMKSVIYLFLNLIRISVMTLLLFNAFFSFCWIGFAVIFDLWKPPELIPRLIEALAPWAMVGIVEIFFNQLVDNGLFFTGMLLFGIALDRQVPQPLH
ncbi:hypothetical protein PFISCL1PPCAC_23106, partial [Pristionchus fissidentatus]